MTSGATKVYVIKLPFPLSTNRLWRATAGRSANKYYSPAVRVHVSSEYTKWKREADALWLTQKQIVRPEMLGMYLVRMVFDAAKRRSNQDGDNLTKCVNDWLQRAGIIKNDCMCEAGSWEWGLTECGCTVYIEGEPFCSGTAL